MGLISSGRHLSLSTSLLELLLLHPTNFGMLLFHFHLSQGIYFSFDFFPKETAHLLFSSILLFVFNLFLVRWVVIVVHGLLISVACRCGAQALGAQASAAAACGLRRCDSQA